jgi:cytochrome c oxidase subunit II
MKRKMNLKMATIMMSVLALGTVILGSQPKPVQQHIDVTASRFSFQPSEITIKKGDPVTIAIHSEDVTHGLVIQQLGVRAEVKKGQEADVTLTPETVGTFEGKCAHFCGKGHGSMVLTVHVVE